MPHGIPVSPERASRILLIAANLLPVEIVESRRGRKARRLVLAGLVAFLLLLTGWYGVANYQTSTARSGLVSAEDDVSRLQAQQNTYADVVTAQAGSQKINAALSALLADDLQWSRLLSDIRTAAPSGVSVDGLSGTLNQATGTGGASSTVQLPDASGQTAIGTGTISGTARNKAAVAAYVDALGGVRGLTGALVGSTAEDKGVVTFNVKVDITDAALGGRYTSTAAKGSGVK